MTIINWNKYLPKKFVYKNESIDELIDKYPTSMIFSKPMIITLVDDEQNAFTKYLEYKRKNALYASKRRAKQRKIEQQHKDYNIKLQNENNKLRKYLNKLKQQKQKLMNFL
jgi:hypothetical protein